MANTRRKKFLHEQRVFLARERAGIMGQIQKGLYPTQFNFPLGIQFELTSQCNLNCMHCYNNSSLSRISEMKYADWGKVVNDIIANGGIFQCILSGGEPLLLGDNLIKIMEPLDRDGTGFVLITNGYLVNQSFVDKIKNFKFFWVQVSIDHFLAEKHDEFRGKKGSYDHALHAALLFSSAGLPLRIAHSITPDSIEYLEDFAELCYKLGASSLICGEIMLSGRAHEHRGLLLTEDGFEKMYELVDALRIKYKGKMEILLSQYEALSHKNHQKLPNTSIIIRPDGTVRLDCTMPFTIGNVLERPFSEIWREKGITCWQHTQVAEYVEAAHEQGYDMVHVNHVSKDFSI